MVELASITITSQSSPPKDKQESPNVYEYLCQRKLTLELMIRQVDREIKALIGGPQDYKSPDYSKPMVQNSIRTDNPNYDLIAQKARLLAGLKVDYTATKSKIDSINENFALILTPTEIQVFRLKGKRLKSGVCLTSLKDIATYIGKSYDYVREVNSTINRKFIVFLDE